MSRSRANVAIVLLILSMIILSNAFEVVGTDERGIVFDRRSGVRAGTLPPGLHFKLPFIEDIVLMSVAGQQSEITTRGRSMDGDLITMVAEIEYHTDPDRAETVYLEVGQDFEIPDRVIDPTVQSAMKSITAQFTTEELLTKPGLIEGRFLEIITEQLRDFNIVADGFYIINMGDNLPHQQPNTDPPSDELNQTQAI